MVCKITCSIAAFAAALSSPAFAWDLHVNTDPIDDTETVMASVAGEGGTLAVACRGDWLTVAVTMNEFLGRTRGSARNGFLRFDSAPAVRHRFHFRSRTAVSEDSITAISVLRGARTSDVLHIRLTDYLGDSHDASFPLPADTSALEEVERACGIELD